MAERGTPNRGVAVIAVVNVLAALVFGLAALNMDLLLRHCGGCTPFGLWQWMNLYASLFWGAIILTAAALVAMRMDRRRLGWALLLAPLLWLPAGIGLATYQWWFEVSPIGF